MARVVRRGGAILLWQPYHQLWLPDFLDFDFLIQGSGSLVAWFRPLSILVTVEELDQRLTKAAVEAET